MWNWETAAQGNDQDEYEARQDSVRTEARTDCQPLRATVGCVTTIVVA